jgi:hypothetical protein
MPDEKANSTNVLLSQILSVSQDTQKIVAAISSSTNELVNTQHASLKIQNDCFDLLQQLVDSISGETHIFTVKVTQIEKLINQLSGQLKK